MLSELKRTDWISPPGMSKPFVTEESVQLVTSVVTSEVEEVEETEEEVEEVPFSWNKYGIDPETAQVHSVQEILSGSL